MSVVASCAMFPLRVLATILLSAALVPAQQTSSTIRKPQEWRGCKLHFDVVQRPSATGAARKVRPLRGGFGSRGTPQEQHQATSSGTTVPSAGDAARSGRADRYARGVTRAPVGRRHIRRL